MFNINFLGGRNIGNNILQFNTEDEKWDRIGTLANKYNNHAVSLVNLNDFLPYCSTV